MLVAILCSGSPAQHRNTGQLKGHGASCATREWGRIRLRMGLSPARMYREVRRCSASSVSAEQLHVINMFAPYTHLSHHILMKAQSAIAVQVAVERNFA